MRGDLARHIAGEIAMSDDPGGTLRKWRTDFEVASTDLAAELDVSASVVSDYENGRRENVGIATVRRLVEGLLAIDDRRGGEHRRRHERVLSAGFESDVVLDLQEYDSAVPVERAFRTVDATTIGANGQRIAGHTVIDSIEAITRLSGEEFYRLYGHSTNRVLVFTGITRGESPLVALRVVNPTPSAVILHGISEDDLWEHAPRLAAIDGYALAVTEGDEEDLLEGLRSLS